MRTYFVYIMSNISRTVLYVGVTNNLERRVQEHKTLSIRGFTCRYKCTDLVYYEDTNSIFEAIEREKQIKKWRRDKKEALITKLNPGQIDLSASLEMT